MLNIKSIDNIIIVLLYTLRPLECDRIKNSLTSKWIGIIWVAEDTAILDTSMDIVTSREVRHKVRAHKCVKHLVGFLIDNYFKQHRIGAKVQKLLFSSFFLFCYPFLSLSSVTARISTSLPVFKGVYKPYDTSQV